ncbi:uncharacterized protein LOC142643876 [Castanea sativa]|uniref:uncharacterized protein LOC142643876 n=1 Tax=Castanea sativa TaxID=21020 RepID=UPI003F652DE1
MDDCGLVYLGFVGNKFTWCKTLQDNITIWERLDRAIVNNECILLFPAARLIHLECAMSNHKPIIIHPSGIPSRRQKSWRFEHVWLKESGCHSAVASTWEGTRNAPCPMLMRKKLKETKGKTALGGSIEVVFALKHELRELLAQEEKLWQQRAKEAWLKEGDQSSTYFHSRASHKFRRNLIKGLRRTDGSWCEGDDQVVALFVEFYQDLF